MPPLTVMIKPASGLCDMRCRYCFYRDVSSRRERESYGLMPKETLEKLVKRAFLYAEHQLSFAFQGGEPTLAGKDFFRFFLSLLKKYQRPGLSVHCALQTNGLSLDGEWADIFREGNFLIGLSLDGTEALHDLNRRTPDGRPTYGRILKSIALLREKGVAYNILCVVTHDLALQGKNVFEALKEHGFLQFIPCLDSLDGASSPYSLQKGDYGQFLCELFPLYEEALRKKAPVSIRIFDNWLGMLLGHSPESCAMCGRCANYYLCEADGSIYPCDFYVLDEWRMGNIEKDSFFKLEKSPVAAEFLQQSLDVHENCRDCPFYSLCRGGCRREREPRINEKLSLNRLCGDYKMFFEKYALSMQKLSAWIQKENGGTL